MKYGHAVLLPALVLAVAFTPNNISAQQLQATKAYATSTALAEACEMAVFIDHILSSVPAENYSTREHLKGIQAIFFVSDYVMAAKTNKSLVLSKSAIVGAFTNVTQDTSFIMDRLQTWAQRSGTLTDHYQGISGIPTERENIQAIKAALAKLGVAIDTESDLLMDCIRYVVHNTQIHDMYGTKPGHKEGEGTSFPAALNSLVVTGDAVFRHRFETKFGLKQDTVTSLMNQLKKVRLDHLSPADLEIPVVRFQ
jgi:hypothetical protein